MQGQSSRKRANLATVDSDSIWPAAECYINTNGYVKASPEFACIVSVKASTMLPPLFPQENTSPLCVQCNYIDIPMQYMLSLKAP